MKTNTVLIHLPANDTRNEIPISLGYIAASLRLTDIETTLLDLPTDSSNDAAKIESIISEVNPKFIGFSGYQSNMLRTLDLAGMIKAHSSRINIVLGGPQAIFMPRKALSQMPAIDILCRGEGETILPAIIEAISAKASLHTVKGVVFRDGETITETRHPAPSSNLDRFPSPFQHGVFSGSKYSKAIILTSRGCPYNCAFCCTPQLFHRRVSYHSPERVLNDMEVCLGQGIKKFIFADASFTVNRKHVESILSGIKKKGWDISIDCETRFDLVDRDLLSVMAEGGIKRILFGLEAVNHSTLKAINKYIGIEKINNIVEFMREIGITPEIMTIYALPKQTFEDALSILDFLKGLGIAVNGSSSGQQLSLFFGSDICTKPEKYGIHVLDKNRPLYLSPGTEFETEHLSSQEIQKIKYHFEFERFVARKKKGMRKRAEFASIK